MSDLTAHYRNHSRGTVPCYTCDTMIMQGDPCWIFQASRMTFMFCSSVCVENATVLKPAGGTRRGYSSRRHLKEEVA